VNKWLNRLICRLGCGLGWAERSTSSIVFARWHQCTRRHSAVSCVKTSEPIDLPLRLWTRVDRKKHKFNHIRQVAPVCPHGRAHWWHLANTAEPSVCGGDAVFCQITLITCYFYHPGTITEKIKAVVDITTLPPVLPHSKSL